MEKTKWIEAKNLKDGMILAWDSGYYDRIDTVNDSRNGDIVVRCNGDTATMLFLPNDVLRVIK
jgi:hypothetical protein